MARWRRLENGTPRRRHASSSVTVFQSSRFFSIIARQNPMRLAAPPSRSPDEDELHQIVSAARAVRPPPARASTNCRVPGAGSSSIR
jgi:hypothetical protein